MPIRGEMFIGSDAVRGRGGDFHAFDPIAGKSLEGVFGSATQEDLDRACTLAGQAVDSCRETSLQQRALFLETIAAGISATGEDLVTRACAETGLPRARIEGERARTVGQLRLFADVVRSGDFLEARIDPEIAERAPARRPDIRQRHIALGPVAVFGASNFPLAFSVAGGDTASALAAGCPVVVKAHAAHPGTSELIGREVQRAVATCGLHPGTFSMLLDHDIAIGSALVADPRIKAAAFTGSRRGGLALLNITQRRPEPIPFYGEMSSINPVILFPAALASRSAAISAGFVASLTLGAGQFCTNPGLVLGLDGPDLDTFIDAAAIALGAVPAAPMLTAGIHGAYVAGVNRLSEQAGVRTLVRGKSSPPHHGQPALFTTDSAAFRKHPALSEEVFGAAALIVRCRDQQDLHALLATLEGQLTIALHMDAADVTLAQELLPLLEARAGRILVNGFGTGVEVCHAMVHGGPYPATSDARSTSVGSLAIRRFLRPVAYQDFPDALLPQSLRGGNPLGIRRLVNGRPETP